MEFKPTRNIVILVQPYCGTITEPGLFLVSPDRNYPFKWANDNRPFYPYGGHIEFIRFKENYKMQRGHCREIYSEKPYF